MHSFSLNTHLPELCLRYWKLDKFVLQNFWGVCKAINFWMQVSTSSCILYGMAYYFLNLERAYLKFLQMYR